MSTEILLNARGRAATELRDLRGERESLDRQLDKNSHASAMLVQQIADIDKAMEILAKHAEMVDMAKRGIGGIRIDATCPNCLLSVPSDVWHEHQRSHQARS